MPTPSETARQEKDLIRLLKKAGFDNVNGGPNYRIGVEDVDVQIDAIASHGNLIFYFECTMTAPRSRRDKLRTFKGSSDLVKNGLSTKQPYSNIDGRKLIQICYISGDAITDLDRELAAQLNITLWDDATIKYYLNLCTAIDDATIFNLLYDHKIKPVADDRISVPAMELKMGPDRNTLMYTFTIDAKQLIKFAYVARRELGDGTFYQRMVDGKRIKNEIAPYIDDGHIFPNSIVVNLEKDTYQFQEATTDVTVAQAYQKYGVLTLDDSYCSCRIIDGQHRLYAHVHSDAVAKLNVSAFVNLSTRKQGEYFIAINKNAKKIKSDLLYDLAGDFSPHTEAGIASNAAKLLYHKTNGTFFQDIKIPSLKDKGTISLNGICTDLTTRTRLTKKTILGEPNPYYDPDPARHSANIAAGLNAYFNLFYSLIDDEQKQKALYSVGMVSVFNMFFYAMVRDKGAKLRNPYTTDILSIIANTLNEFTVAELKEKRASTTSDANKREFNATLIHMVREREPTFAVQGESPQDRYTPLPYRLLNDCVPNYKTFDEQWDNKLGIEIATNTLAHFVFQDQIGRNWWDDKCFCTDNNQIEQARTRASEASQGPIAIWRRLNFGYSRQLTTHTKALDHYFKELYSANGIGTDQEVDLYCRVLWDYANDAGRHPDGIIHMRPIPAKQMKTLHHYHDCYSAALMHGLTDYTQFYRKCHNFFITLLENMPDNLPSFEEFVPLDVHNWIIAPTSVDNIHWEISLHKDPENTDSSWSTRRLINKISLCIGFPRLTTNETILGQISQKKTQIEEAFDSSLDWVTTGGRVYRYISSISKIEANKFDTETEWQALHDDIVRTYTNLVEAIEPHIEELAERRTSET